MASTKKLQQKKCIYSCKRYWYHVSTTLRRKETRLIPRDESKSFNRPGTDIEPSGKRICVSPTIEQCITAIPYSRNNILSIYRTKGKVKAYKSKGVFDASVTNEGWLLRPIKFIKMGRFSFQDVELGLDIKEVIREAASSGDKDVSKNTLKWWKEAKIEQFIKSS